MRKKVTILAVLVLAAVAAAAVNKNEVMITEPQNKAEVPEKAVIKGTVSDPSAKVWLIVRPLATEDYWVQGQATVNADGTWQATANVGRPGSVDVGEWFQIAAVANPKKDIKAGDVLGWWPRSKWRSKPIRIKRK